MIEFVLGWLIGGAIALILIENGVIDKAVGYSVVFWRWICAKLKK